MGNSTTLSYGGEIISPVPFITISKAYQKSNDGRIIGSLFNCTLQGTVSPVPTGTEFNITSVDALLDDIRDIFAKDGHRLLLKCDDETLLEAYPRINGIDTGPDNTNWVLKAPYVVNLEFDDDISLNEDDDKVPEYVSQVDESWNIETVEDPSFSRWNIGGINDTLPYVVRVTHNIGAVGKTHYTANGGNPASGDLTRLAWEQAREYVVPRLGFKNDRLACTGVLNFTAENIGAFNHQRLCNIDERGGSFSVSESWLGVPTGLAGVLDGATENFDINVRNSASDGLTNVTINGNIVGLEERTFGSASGSFNITRSKFEAASGYYSEVKARLLNRAIEAYETAGDTIVGSRDLNPTPVESNVGYSPGAGQINYTYVYDSRPCNFLENAISENISVSDNHPTNVIASIVVLGRANGPILQDLGTVTAGTRNVNIEAVIAPPSGCDFSTSIAGLIDAKPTGVSGILCGFENELTSVYSQVFKQSDVENWNVKTGQYSRSVQWIFANCDGTGPVTTFAGHCN